MLPKNVLYYGKDEPLPESTALQAGPVNLVFEAGDLRYIRLGEKEVLRRIYVAIRDRNWGTVAPLFSGLVVQAGGDSFRISYQVENRQGEIDFTWQGEIVGEADGTITFTMDGLARSTFWRNRIGFCVLHPASCAGAACRIEHVDGSTETSTFPVFIVPDQPVAPFAEMRALAHEVEPGVWAEVRFQGEVFEMEDQRNWTDASFKTFCTPLRLPYPVEVRQGTRIRQSVALALRGAPSRPARAPASARRPGRAPLTVRLEPQSPAAPLPAIGLGVASHGQALSERQLARLKVLRLSHLRADLRLSDPDYPRHLELAAGQARRLGLPLEAALFVPEGGEAELARLRGLLDRWRPTIAAWLVYPQQERYQGGSPSRQAVELARRHLGDYDPSALFGTGTNTDFIFLARTPPPVELVDLVAFAINPQVHAFDNASLVETLQAQASAIASARRLAGNLPVAVSPVTLKPRFNPYATRSEPEVPAGQLPPQVDVRQMSLFAAGWTAGSLKHLAEGGASRLTFFETTGWRGVMETEAGSPLPEVFRSLPGGVFPVYHLLAEVGEFAGGLVLPCRSSEPLAVDGLALRRGDRRRVLLANFCAESQRVLLTGLEGQARLRRLDETNAEVAMRSPEQFRRQPGEQRPIPAGGLEVELLPFAIACVDA